MWDVFKKRDGEAMGFGAQIKRYKLFWMEVRIDLMGLECL